VLAEIGITQDQAGARSGVEGFDHTLHERRSFTYPMRQCRG
jgi:hypothetical protein